MHFNSAVVSRLFVLALLFTLLNASTPLCIDVTFYHYPTEQIAQHPLNPYAFRIFQTDRRESLWLAAAAGLVAGIAAQTKYNGLVAPAVMLLHAIIFKRMRMGVVAALIAGLFFMAWESFIFLGAGHSHFLTQSEHYGSVHL